MPTTPASHRSPPAGHPSINHGGVTPLDPARAAAHLAATDPALARLIERVGHFDAGDRSEPDVFASLLRAIVYQQLSGKAAATIHRRVLSALGGDTPSPTSVTTTNDETLRAAGLSANKTRALRALANATQNGDLPDDSALSSHSDAALIECYSALPGIGRWTVEMLLIFHLRRPDVLPIHDLGVRKGFARTFEWSRLPKPSELAAACDHWRPYRSVGSWYMWRATEL